MSDIEWGLYCRDRDGDSYKVRTGDNEIPSILIQVGNSTIALTANQLDELYSAAKELLATVGE